MDDESGQHDPESLLAVIAKRLGRTPDETRTALTRHGVTFRPSLAVPKRLCLRSLSFQGEKKGEKTSGPITFDWPDLGPGIWAVTSGRNLRGKSTVLGMVRWCLTGKRSSIPPEMAEWFHEVRLTFTLDGQPFEVEIADAIQVSGTLWRGRGESRRAQARFLSEDQFKTAMSDFFMGQLGLQPLVTHTVRNGLSVDQPHDWPFLFNAMSIEPNPEYLFGTVMTSALPTRMMQMFLGIPWTSTNADLVAARGRLKNQAKQDGAAIDALRKRRRVRIQDLQLQIDTARAELAKLPEPGDDRRALAATNRAYAEAEARLRAAETNLSSVEADVDAATAATLHARRMLQDFVDDRAAGMVFRALEPVCCPRCDEVFAEERRDATRADHTCVVCGTPDVPVEKPSEGDAKLTEAVEAAEAVLSAQRTRRRRAKDAVDAVKAESESALASCQAIEKRLAIPSRRRTLEAEILEMKARLEELTDEEGDSPSEDNEAVMIDTAQKVVEDVFKPQQDALLKEISELIREYAVLFGVENLEAATLLGNTTLKLTKAGIPTSFSKQTAGERARLKIAATLAIITIAERRGVGRHPGLLLIDSPGANEMVSQDYDKLVSGLAALPAEFDHLQVFVAAVDSPMISEHVPEKHRKHAPGDTYLW